MNFKIKIRNKEYSVELKEERRGIRIKIGNKEFIFVSIKEDIVFKPQNISDNKDSSRKEIISSLSGIVTSIFVKEGEIIKSGQKILILSAMKMENEIVSEGSGKIEKIMVKENQQIKEGDILVILK